MCKVTLTLGEHTDQAIANTLENTVTPISSNAGNTFGDLWYLIFSGISHAADKRKIEYAAKLEKYKRETEAKILAIPEDDLKEPDIQIAGQALEKSKYCVENETLRSMFSSLIASSMMKSKENIVHPSFAEIITQMSSDDANALLSLYEHPYWTVLKFLVYFSNTHDYYHLFNNIWHPCESLEELTKCQLIADSLVRLGLVEITYSEYIGAENEMDESGERISSMLYNHVRDNGTFDNTHSEKDFEIAVHKGSIKLTNFGVHFLQCVL